MMGMGRIETTPGSLLNGGLERWTGGLRVVPSGGHRHCINVVLRAVWPPVETLEFGHMSSNLAV